MAEREDSHSVFFVEGMCCADEQTIIEKKLRSLDGVSEFKFNLVAQRLYVTHSVPNRTIASALHDVGFTATPYSGRLAPPRSLFERHQTAITTLTAGIAAVAAICLSAVGVSEAIVRTLYIAAILLGGWRIAWKGWKALSTYSLDMNVLMSVAVVGAVAIGKWEEAAAVIVLFAVAGLLEETSMRRTRNAIASLLESAPAMATVRRNGKDSIVPTDDVRPGDTVIIHPGEKIPVDGRVAKGSSMVNQSSITGESSTVEKHPGSLAFAGTINERGSLEITTTGVGDDTTLAHIVHLVEEAQARRSPSQDYVDRLARRYTPTVLGLAVLVVLIPPLFFGAAFGIWLYRGLVLLVIACPCALVISTPVTIVSGLAAAARHGILIKGGRFLEEASKIKAILFDKTGTLTIGIPSVTDVVQLNSLPVKEILRIAALGEMKSEHSIAHAVISKAQQEKIDLGGNVDHFESIAGRGIVMTIEGTEYTVGNHQFVEERGLCSALVEASLEALEAEGKTAIVVSSAREALGVIGVSDPAREESKDVIKDLRKSGVNDIMMISGDSAAAVRSIALTLGIENSTGDLMPADKVAFVEKMRMNHRGVAMVGDGINDAPALAASSLGIAMGISGTDVAIETADVVLMKDDLSKITTLISIGKKTMSVLRQNIALSLAMKAAFLLLAVFGLATLWMAVIADDGVTLLVILNSLRLLREG